MTPTSQDFLEAVTQNPWIKEIASRAEDRVGVTDWCLTGLPLISYRHAPEDVAQRMTAAGFRVHARAVREPELQHESTPQAFIVARATSQVS